VSLQPVGAKNGGHGGARSIILRLPWPPVEICFDQSHGGGYTIGRQEFIERWSYLQPKHYAQELTELGYVALCIDQWIFGERSHTTEADMFKTMLWRGQVLWGMMVDDSLRALDWLLQAPGVDPHRVGTLGMSMGSTMAWWLATLDDFRNWLRLGRPPPCGLRRDIPP